MACVQKLTVLAVATALCLSTVSTATTATKSKDMLPFACEAFDTMHTLLGCNVCGNYFCVAIEFGITTCNELTGMADISVEELQEKLRKMLYDHMLNQSFKGSGVTDFIKRWTDKAMEEMKNMK